MAVAKIGQDLESIATQLETELAKIDRAIGYLQKTLEKDKNEMNRKELESKIEQQRNEIKALEREIEQLRTNNN